ncbi:MAG: FHA domain-containing protein [Myxococcaceae bacterium]
MRLLVRQGLETTELDLSEGLWTVGGAEEDAVRIEGLMGGLVELRLQGTHLTATLIESLPINGSPFPANVARLFTPGERITLPDGTELALVEGENVRAGAETVAVLRNLFQGELLPVATRAATLTVLTGLEAGRVFPLSGSDELGRGEQSALRIRDRSVSRRHARVLREGTGFTVEDLGTPNGTFVSAVRCEGKHPLRNGDTIEMGRTTLRFNGSTPEPSADGDDVASPTEAVSEDEGMKLGTEEDEEIPPSLAKREWALLSLATMLATTGAWLGWVFR